MIWLLSFYMALKNLYLNNFKFSQLSKEVQQTIVVLLCEKLQQFLLSLSEIEICEF